jgi:general secretion pathway protein M
MGDTMKNIQAPGRPTVPHALRQRWTALSLREQRLLTLAAGVLSLAGLWWLGLAPALRTLQQAPAQQAQWDAQWQHLTALQAQAQALQKLPRMTQAAALKALQNVTTERLGTHAKLTTTGDRCTVTLTQVTPEALAQWLAQVRTQARAVPVEVKLQRAALASEGAPSPAATTSTTPTKSPAWSGSVVLSLPAS